MSTTNPTTNTRFIAKKTPQAAVAALATMACGAAALYIAMGRARIGFGGDLWSFLAGLVGLGVIAGIILASKIASEWTGTRSFALIITLLVAVVILTVICLKAFTVGWAWSQFGLGVLVLGLWVVATAIHLIHKFKS